MYAVYVAYCVHDHVCVCDVHAYVSALVDLCVGRDLKDALHSWQGSRCHNLPTQAPRRSCPHNKRTAHAQVLRSAYVLTLLASWSLKIAMDTFIHSCIVLRASSRVMNVGLLPMGAISSSCRREAGPVNLRVMGANSLLAGSM